MSLYLSFLLFLIDVMCVPGKIFELNWIEIDDFLGVWPWNLTDDIEKQ